MRLKNWIDRRIANNFDVNILISGGTGMGKSWAGLRICELVDPSFSSNRVVFGITDYIERYHNQEQSLQPGQAVMFDETGVEISGLKVMHREVKNVLDELMTNRKERTIGVYTTPSKDDVPQRVLRLMHLWIKITGRNKHYSFGKAYYLTYDEFSRKVKYKTVRARISNYAQRFQFNPPSQELIIKYEAAKSAYREELGEKLQGKKPSRPLTPKQQEVLGFSNAGMTQMEIANKLGISQTVISRTLKAVRNKGYAVITPYSSIKGGGIYDK